MSFWRAGADGVTVMVKVHPRSRRPGVRGIQESADGSRLKIDVTEPAEDGRANRAVCALLAKALHQPASSVRILTGVASRDKVLMIEGDAVVLAEQLNSL
jgi:uncharacterized protein